MSAPDLWRLLAGFERFLAQHPEASADYEADLQLIQQLEAAAVFLDQGKPLPSPIAAPLLAAMRRLLASLFRTRVERDQFRASLHLLEQGQALLLPLTETPKKP